MSTAVKTPSRPRRQRQKDEMKQDIVAQVHKTIKKEITSTPDAENVNNSEHSESSSETNTNRTYKVEDKNDNYSMNTPSREISVDGESQISSKILTLIETEMKRDINKLSHFTDSRPQSLSFYEEEKIPEELSGNLELLSPEERKHYKKRKEHVQIMDTDERNAYNAIQDLYKRDDEITTNTTKRSKSRKKRHNDSEHGLGDSREMMIPKEKRKSKKKKRESSPGSSNGKRKHRKREEEIEPKSEIVVALEELQDDVFESMHDEACRADKIRRSPRRADKLYVQRKNRFELVARPSCAIRNVLPEERAYEKGLSEYYPIEAAAGIQKYWLTFTTLCHGLLGGMALIHIVYIRSNYLTNYFDGEFLINYSIISDGYICLFYMLCVISLVSVCDRYDIGHLDFAHLKDMVQCRKSSIVVLAYAVALMTHLCAARIDDKIGIVGYDRMISYHLANETALNISTAELESWTNLSYCRDGLVLAAWTIVSMFPGDDMLYIHLKNMEKYIPNS